MIALAISMDGNAIDVLHHQEWFPFAGYAAVQQPGDQWVVEPGKHLALEPEPLPEKVCGQGQVNQLDGYLLLEVSIRAMSQVHGAHPAATNQPVDFIRTDAFLFMV